MGDLGEFGIGQDFPQTAQQVLGHQRHPVLPFPHRQPREVLFPDQLQHQGIEVTEAGNGLRGGQNPGLHLHPADFRSAVSSHPHRLEVRPEAEELQGSDQFPYPFHIPGSSDQVGDLHFHIEVAAKRDQLLVE